MRIKMVEIDFVSIVVPVALTIAFSIIVMGAKKLGRTSEGTLSGTIKLEHVSSELGELEKRIDKSFDKLENLIITKEKEQRSSLERVWERLDLLTRGHELNTYRIDSIERKNGGDKSAI